MDTSLLAYYIPPRPSCYVPPSGESIEAARLLKLYGPLLWLFRMWARFTAGAQASPPQPVCELEALASMCSRAQRRSLSRSGSGHDISVLKQRALVSRIFSRGLTARQYMEKKARLFIGGRVRAYGLRYRGSRLLRRARLTCYDHGSWRAPQNAALGGGHWDVQLPPN